MMARVSAAIGNPLRRPVLARVVVLCWTVFGVAAQVASAHEVKVVTSKRPGQARSSLLPIVVPGTHLSVVPSTVGFGTVQVGQSVARTVSLTNTTADTLTLSFALPADVTVSPAAVTLGPAGGAGAGATVTLTWAPELGGPPEGALTILVRHARVGTAARESVPLSGTATAVLDIAPRSLDFGLIDRNATATKTLVVTNLKPTQTTVSIRASSWEIGSIVPAIDQTLGPAGSASASKSYAVTFDPAGTERTFSGHLTVTGTPSGGTATAHVVHVVGKSTDLGGPSGVFSDSGAVRFDVVRAGTPQSVDVHLWNRSAVDTVEVSFALVGGSGLSVTPSELTVGPGQQPTVTVSWTPVGNTTLEASLTAYTSYPEVSDPVVQTKAIEGWSKTYPVLPSSFAFGGTPIGVAKAIAVPLSNPSADIVTVEFPGGGDFALTPNDQSLGQLDVFGQSHPYHITLAAGQSRTVSFVWTPSSSPPVNRLMDFRSWYPDTTLAGFLIPLYEQLPVSGTVLNGPQLVLRTPTGQPLSGLDFGRLTLGTNPAPSIDVELANVGDAPMPLISGISIQGFYNIIGGLGANCSLVRGNYFCFEPLAANPTYLLAGELAGLGAGQKVSTRVRVYPGLPEEYSDQLAITYDAGASSPTLSIPISAEVVPYLLDDPLAQAVTGAAATKGAPPDDGGDDDGGTFVVDVMQPRLARGLGVDQVFAGVGEIDHVNLFNGNLFMQIPLGGSYPVGGELSYRLQLSYNSNVWDRWMQLQRLHGLVQLFAPQAGANAGVGWMVHLGRLCEPVDLDGLRGASQTVRDKSLCRTTEYKYFDPSGAAHVFETHLHSDSASVARSPDIEAIDVLYTQDASYLRMKRVSATLREIHFPDGTIHRFEKRTLSQWGDSWPDVWRLTQIRDRNGNHVDVTYEARTDGAPGVQWRFADGHRAHLIKLRPDPSGYYPYVVDKVELAKFGGGFAVYSFGYTTRTVTRLFDLQGQPPPGPSQVTVPVLSTLVLPDGTSYRFSYFLTGAPTGQNTLRASAVDLPTGGRIEWEYGNYAQPSTTACAANDITLRDRITIPGVTSRIVRGAGGATGAIIDHKRFSQHLTVGAGVPSDYCDDLPRPLTPGPNDPAVPPEAESSTTVISPLAFDGNGNAVRNSVTLHYSSAFPFSISPGGPALAAGGWNGHEFGLPFTRNVRFNPAAAAGEEEFLSTRVYECGALSQPILDGNMASCDLLRSTYVRYGRSPSFKDFLEPGSAANPRVVVRREVFEDDGGNWVRTENSTFDGLGHFRNSETTASFGSSRRQKSLHNYNPAFELITDGETITQNIDPPDLWILDTFNRHWVRGWKRVGGNDQPLPRRGGELCWTLSDNRKTLDRERSWADENPATNDLVVRYTYLKGDRTKEEYFGGDVQGVDPGCDATLGSPQYTLDNTYLSGVLATSRYAGASYFTTDRTIDASTGLTASERDSGGVETTFTYDSMGRLRQSQHAVLATQTFEYALPGVDAVATPRVTVRQHPRNQPGVTLTESRIDFDALGRVFEERQRQPDGSFSRRRFTYTPRGLTATVTTRQADTAFAAGERAVYSWDALGRLTRAESPDGSVRTTAYTGARLAALTVPVGTTFVADGQAGTVRSSDVTLTRHFDSFGRVERLQTPEHDTDIRYDSLGHLASRVRRRGGATQTRSMVTDGLGFLRSESLPEKTGDVTHGGYDALGNVGQVVDGPNTLAFHYDASGRVVSVSGNGAEVKRLTYYDVPGPSNGRLHTATRRHVLTAANTPGFPGIAGTWTVTETYRYGSEGAIAKRVTNVTDNQGQPLANFDQLWTYDALGNVATTRYPRACDVDFATCYANGRSVTYSYSSGRLTSVTAGNGLGASALTYHANGMIASVTHDGGLVDSYGVDPDDLPRVGSIDLANQAMRLGAHRYDGSGNLTQIGNRRYAYDATSRLKDHYQLGVRKDFFAYDAFDNLTAIDGIDQGIDSHSNRITGQTHDGAGNQTSDDCADYTYDALGLLRTHHQNPGPPGCSGSATWVSLYDADDRRILLGGTTSGFRWTVRDLSGKILSTFTSSGPGIQRVKDYTYRDGLPLAAREGSTSHHLHLDHLGSIRAVSEGSTVTTRTFSPYGEPLGADLGEALGFTGHEHDPSGETVYMLARTYSNARGRFLQADPARATSAWSLFAYAANNPILRVDPDGLADGPAGSSETERCSRENQMCGMGLATEDILNLSEARSFLSANQAGVFEWFFGTSIEQAEALEAGELSTGEAAWTVVHGGFTAFLNASAISGAGLSGVNAGRSAIGAGKHLNALAPKGVWSSWSEAFRQGVRHGVRAEATGSVRILEKLPLTSMSGNVWWSPAVQQGFNAVQFVRGAIGRVPFRFSGGPITLFETAAQQLGRATSSTALAEGLDRLKED